MPNKNYNNGRAKEYRIKKKLEEQNYFVIRSAGSHSAADLVALKRLKEWRWVVINGILTQREVPVWEIRLIQCKPRGGYLTPDERAKKAELESRLGMEIEVM